MFPRSRPANPSWPGTARQAHVRSDACDLYNFSVTGCAEQRKQTLVKGGKLDASWSAIQPEKAETIDGKKGKEWKLTFKNPAVTDASKQTLYMFYSLPGNFIAANFTGQ